MTKFDLFQESKIGLMFKKHSIVSPESNTKKDHLIVTDKHLTKIKSFFPAKNSQRELKAISST